MNFPTWLRWTIFIIIVFTSLILPLTLFEGPLSTYGETVLDWAGNNELFIAIVVIIALTADVLLPVPNGLTNTLAGISLGWALASFVVWIGLNFGACVGYILGRFAARPLAKKMISEGLCSPAKIIFEIENFAVAYPNAISIVNLKDGCLDGNFDTIVRAFSGYPNSTSNSAFLALKDAILLEE